MLIPADIAMQKDYSKVVYRLTLLLIAVAGTFFLLLLDRAYRSEVMQESDRQLNEAASAMQRHLTMTLNSLTLVATDLHAFLLTQSDPPDSQSFTDFAATLHNHYPALDSLVYVGPDRVIRDIYPRVGNERAIGLDLSKRPVAPYLEKAIRERQFVVDPPHTMSNGRLAVIARSPMFRGEKFVGLAQAILNIPDVVQLELDDLGKEFTIQLLDENGKLFWGEPLLEGSIQRREVVVGDGTWKLAVAPASPPAIKGAVLALIWGVGGLVLLLTMRSVQRDYHLRLSLQAEVEKTTREIRLRNEELERQVRQRQEAEAKVHRNEQRLREAQQIAHLGNWEWDIANNRIYWSDEFYRILGFTPQEFEPAFEVLLSRIHPDDQNAIRKGIAEAFEFKNPVVPEHRILLPEGGIRYVRAYGVSECNAAGKPLRIAGTLQDITHQKLAVMALEESERKYRAVLENASDGIVIATVEGKLLDGNQRIQTLLGYRRDELLNLHVSEIHPPEDAEKLHIAFSSIRERGFSLFEHLLLRKDGTTIPVEVAGTYITFDSHQVILGIFRDIRERKRIEAELHQHRNHLEHLVQQRTAELVALNDELEAFSYSVSHDLRAPLRAINGFTAALREDCGAQLDDTGCDYLNRIQSASERMVRLIDDLLHLSHMIRAEVHWENVSLTTLVAELLLELHAADPEREVRCIVADGITTQGDPTLIRSLLQNLLSNAWKFTRGRADALIEFGAEDRTVYFVRDNGIGFEMLHAEAIFNPFHRLHGAADYEGSGIGLATVQRIVHRHGGKIWAESEPQRGATFYFTLGEYDAGWSVADGAMTEAKKGTGS